MKTKNNPAKKTIIAAIRYQKLCKKTYRTKNTAEAKKLAPAVI